MNPALICVDLQNDFCDPYKGQLYVPRAGTIAGLISDYMRGEFSLIVASQDWHQEIDSDHQLEYGIHCEAGSWGAQFFHRFNQNRANVWVRKGQHSAGASAFDGVDARGRTLHDLLQAAGVTEVEVCGVATDVCVSATVGDAIRLGYRTVLLPGLTAAVGGDEAMRDTVAQAIAWGAYIR